MSGSYRTHANGLTAFAVAAWLSLWLPQCGEIDETANFAGEIRFEFNRSFLELARRAEGGKQISFLPPPAAPFESVFPAIAWE